MKKETKNTSVSIPIELYNRLKELAEMEERPINYIIVKILRENT